MRASDAQDAPVLWRPDPAAVERAHLTRFAASVGLEPYPYERLHRFSVGDLEAFWGALWDFAGIVGSRTDEVLRVGGAARMTGARFFPGATLNFAENALAGDAARLAVIEAGEGGPRGQLTLGELRQRVARAQRGLEGLGVGPGDRVAGIVPNDTDALVVLLAVASIGAVWSTCAPEFGLPGVIDRFGQIEPKVLVAARRYHYHGREHDLTEKLTGLAGALGGLEHVVTVGEGPALDVACATHALAELEAGDAKEPAYARLPFDHPLYIVYTSGTTGLPKCIVHSAGGVLLTHRKEHTLHCDVGPGDRAFYYSNTAWMMYHWLVSMLASGAAVVLYDGAPLPRPDAGAEAGTDARPHARTEAGRDAGALWRLAEQAEVTHFGTSPRYLAAVADDGYAPGREHDLSSLRMIMTAGSPLTAEQFHWAYREVKADLCLASISGGTEILGCFVMGNPTAPVRAGEIQGPALGMAVAVMDDRGAPLIGRKGDLVCTEPFPSMPLRFHGEDGWQRYLDTYFSQRREVWTHGDLAELRLSGGVVIYGRTDTTLNPGGVRIGTAEIYRVVEQLDEVADSLVVGYPRDGDIEVWLFVALEGDARLDDGLADRLRAALRAQASPRHVPARIMTVPDIPYTLSGKKVEKAVLELLTGGEVSNEGSLANPESLAAFAESARQESG